MGPDLKLAYLSQGDRFAPLESQAVKNSWQKFVSENCVYLAYNAATRN